MSDYTLESRVLIRVLNYDVFVEELKTWAPMISFRPVKLKFIINFLNNRLDVEFQFKEEELKVLTFIKQYNTIAKEENERLKNNVYAVANAAEEVLMRKLKLKDTLEKRQSDKNNPFVIKEHVPPPVNPSKRVSIMNNNNKVVVKRKKVYEIIDEATGKKDIEPEVKNSGYDGIELTF